ncbi:MAG: chemotaxis protein CheA [Nitrospira sp.]|nr:MAG: chemotaxis protein CheA [Nitrospira sp.]
MSGDLSQFKDAFFEESAELLQTMEEGLLQLEQSPDDLDLLNRIFRAAHSIKGSSGMFGFTAVTEFTHKVEGLLDKLRNAQIVVTEAVMTALLEATDGMKSLVEAAHTGQGADPELFESLKAKIEAVQRGGPSISPAEPAPAQAAAPAAAVPESRRAVGASESDSGHRRLGEILVQSGVVSEDQLSQALSAQKRVGEILVEQKAVTPVQVAKALEKQQQIDAAAVDKKSEAASIRVDTVKIDKLINLVGELVITQSMLSDLGRRFEPDQLPVLLERLSQLERNTREIQERVMSVRMMPIGSVFNRFPRLVRDLASKNGKKITLHIHGEGTELDKTVLESIGDPLTHLVRNSADHGLEPPEERVKAGKPEQGVIRLNAYHEGGAVCITITDDGRGLNREKILAKALKQGLIGDGEPLPDDQIWALIFKPGFSTADKLTDVSGRGVGMDVVRRNIEGLGGSVGIKTQAGQGSTFTLKLPLTLAIIEGMTVRVGTETYIVPLVSIVESIQPTAEAVKPVVGKGEVVEVRGTYVPVVRLHEAFGIKADVTEPADAILVIVETEGEQVALSVDELLGQQQVVIKSLEQNFRKVPGVAGATILGDGTVGLIVDVRGLIDVARQQAVAGL